MINSFLGFDTNHEIVADRTNTARAVVAASMTGNGQLVPDFDVEYGTHTMMYAGLNQLARNRRNCVVVTVRARMDEAVDIARDGIANPSDQKLSTAMTKALMADREFAARIVAPFYQPTEAARVGENMAWYTERLHQIYGARHIALTVLGRNGSALRMAHQEIGAIPGTYPQIIGVTQSKTFRTLKREFDGAKVFQAPEEVKEHRIFPQPRDYEMVAPAMYFLVNGSRTAAETVRCYFDNWSTSWATGIYKVNDAHVVHGFLYFNGFQVLYRKESVINLPNGGEHYKVRDFLRGEINSSGSNIASFIKATQGMLDGRPVVYRETEQAPMHMLFPGFLAITSASRLTYPTSVSYVLSKQRIRQSDAWSSRFGLAPF